MRAPDREGHWHNQGCSKCPRSNSFSGSEHHDDDRPLCRRSPSLASVSSPRVGRKGRYVTHSITSSATANIAGGTLTPSALAVFRFMTSSNVVGCSIGKSLGLAPLKILSTYTAAR